MATTQFIAEAGVPQVIVAREFDAPRELLFRAHIEPDLLVQWLGPRALKLIIDHLDARHGGTWRYVHRDAEGNAFAFHGVYHGTPSPDGIVQTSEFEGMPGHVCLQTTTFADLGAELGAGHGGRTLLRINTVFQSVADRDAMVASGLEDGFNEAMERLDELVARLTPVR